MAQFNGLLTEDALGYFLKMKKINGVYKQYGVF